MGNQSKPYALVSMLNKDVYCVSIETAREIKKRIGREITFVDAMDIKSGAEVSIAIHHVSSVVIREGNRYADR